MKTRRAISSTTALLLAACSGILPPVGPNAAHDPTWRPPAIATQTAQEARPRPKPRPRASRANRTYTRPATGPLGGLASWYAGARGACGPLVGFYAAHRTLPCGTRLRVTGAAGTAAVTILDRGPAAWTGKAIDLSPASFRKACGDLSRGVCRVRWSRA